MSKAKGEQENTLRETSLRTFDFKCPENSGREERDSGVRREEGRTCIFVNQEAPFPEVPR